MGLCNNILYICSKYFYFFKFNSKFYEKTVDFGSNSIDLLKIAYVDVLSNASLTINLFVTGR